MKTTTPGSIGGMNVAIAWPNMWLSGSRFRNRIGKNGRAHFRYFSTSRSTGTMLASTLRWVMTTPFGSAVAPDVKMISAVASGPIAGGRGPGSRSGRPSATAASDLANSMKPPYRPLRAERAGVDGLADEHRLGVDDRRDLAQESGDAR